MTGYPQVRAQVTPLVRTQVGRRGGSTDPILQITSQGVLESASVGTTIGTLSVANLTGGVTVTAYTITADPDSKFSITSALLKVNGALNRETATSHSVTISAALSAGGPVVGTFIIEVINVFEAATLAALTLDADEIVQGATAGTLIGAVVGKTTGSSLSLTDDASGRFALSGTNIVAGAVVTDYDIATSHNITLRETLADSSNSPRDSVIAITVLEEEPTFTAVIFDGTNDYWSRGAAFTGVSDAETFTFVCRFLPAGDGTFRFLIQDAQDNFKINIGNLDQVQGYMWGAAERISFNTAFSLFEAADGWCTLFIAGRSTSGSEVLKIYRNDTDITPSYSHTAGTFDLTPTDWKVFAAAAGTSKFNGQVEFIWFDDVYRDVSDSAVRAKFTAATIGADGSGPGAQPILFITGAASVWNAGTNLGTGGNGTMSGAVTVSTLAALTLDADEIVQGAAAGTSVGAIVGKTGGSSLSLTDTAGNRFALTGSTIVAGATATDYDLATSHNITIRETLAGSSNSPRDSVIAITVLEEEPGTEITQDGLVITMAGTITPVWAASDDGWLVPGPIVTFTSLAMDPTRVTEEIDGDKGRANYLGEGVMVDPEGFIYQGFDDRSGGGATRLFDGDLTETLPLVVDATAGPKTVWFYRGLDDLIGEAYTSCAAIVCITVYPGAIPANSIRPPIYAVAGGKPMLTTADIDYNIFTPVTVPVGATEPDWDDIHMLRRPLIQSGEYAPPLSSSLCCPVLSQHAYPAYQASWYTGDVLMGMVADIADRELLINRIVAKGGDIEAQLAHDGSSNVFPAGGGFGSGYESLLFWKTQFLGETFTRPSTFVDWASQTVEYFTEDSAVYAGVDDRPLYGTKGFMYPTGPYQDNHDTRDVDGLVDAHAGNPPRLSGTAQSGSTTNIRLAAGTATGVIANGYVIAITGGTGAGQERFVSAYNNTTKDLTPSVNFSPAPNNTSTYAYRNAGEYQTLTLPAFMPQAMAMVAAGEDFIDTYDNAAFFGMCKRHYDEDGCLQDFPTAWNMTAAGIAQRVFSTVESGRVSTTPWLTPWMDELAPTWPGSAPSGTWTSVFDSTSGYGSAYDNAGWSPYAIVSVIPVALFSATGGTQIRITFYGPSAGEAAQFTDVFVGNGGGGDVYDFTGDQVRLQASASNTVEAPVGGSIVTDAANFVKDGTNPLVVAVKYSNGSKDDARIQASVTNADVYYSNGADASVQDKSGYTGLGTDQIWSMKVELFI